MGRPRTELHAAYALSTSSKRPPSPSAIACWRKLDSCPPGISWRYTVPVGDRRPASNGAVHPTHGLPVGLEVTDGIKRQPGFATGVVGGRHYRRKSRLARHAGQGRRRAVNRIDPNVDRRKIRGQLSTRSVVSMEVDRGFESLPQRGNQRASSRSP